MTHDQEERELLQRIAVSNEAILAALIKPKGKARMVADFLLTAVGIGSGISIVDAVVKFIGG